ncbi:hypothetical protein QN277_017885 [Acacia crassicarpa]|uniref:EF-hand domain-containing protein n=1 Tax=Acacia crassicarpa TaxID=499986 RepID=A0AAE1JS87_9FABA|nr:hypothetical protein QN277_017885 [Acacia crassicarpa]
MPVYIPIPPKVVARPVLTEKEVRKILARADRNGDGCLTMDELKVALKEIGSRWPCFRAHSFLRIADFNRDGKFSGKAEMDKLVACILCWYHQKY